MRKFGHGKRVLASVREELDMIREVSAIEGENMRMVCCGMKGVC